MRLLLLPDAWQSDLKSMLGDDDHIITLRNRRSRLIAERRRLQEAYIRGDMEDDEDIYRRHLNRIRLELEQLPTKTDLVYVEQAAQVIDSVGDVWDGATDKERRTLVRTLLKELRVDVLNSRLLWLIPHGVFVPLFRSIPILDERELGSFTPVWPLDRVQQHSHRSLPPVTRLPETSPALPFVATWPWSVKDSARITEPLSHVLKERRKLNHLGGLAAEIPHPGVPEQRKDGRKWPTMNLMQMTDIDLLEDEDWQLAFLHTPMLLQDHPRREALPEKVFRQLAEQGYWSIIDVLPTSMPAHWAFHYFPELWELAQERYWSNYQIYNNLRDAGFHVIQTERVFQQPFSLQVAYRIAQQRPGLLADISDDCYAGGMDELKTDIAEQGAETLIPSEIALAEILALNGKPWKRKR